MKLIYEEPKIIISLLVKVYKNLEWLTFEVYNTDTKVTMDIFGKHDHQLNEVHCSTVTNSKEVGDKNSMNSVIVEKWL